MLGGGFDLFDPLGVNHRMGEDIGAHTRGDDVVRLERLQESKLNLEEVAELGGVTPE